MPDPRNDLGDAEMQHLTLRYLNSDLTAEQLQVLRNAVASNPESANRFIGIVRLTSLLREQAQRDVGIRTELSLPSQEADYKEVFEELLQLEREAQILPHPTEYLAAEQGTQKSVDTLQWRDAMRGLGYLLGQTLNAKPALKVYAAAASVLLAVALFFVFSGNDTTPDQLAGPSSETTSTMSRPTELALVDVATLTATHNAKWAEHTLARGSHLQAGQRLTLTAGFAEITTNRGAVAILEAPATIVLLDKNALRLHAGKLVGICETQSSKGFLVRTPHMDVTDLGTEFGVEVGDNSQATQVHVITGEVRVSVNREGSEPINLIADQAVKVDARVIESIGCEPARFERDIEIAPFRPRFEGGQTAWLGRPPADLRIDRQTSKALQVYLEHAGLALDQPLVIDSDRDTPWPPDQLAALSLAAGQTVDVYLLHFDTPGTMLLLNREHTLRFDRPILGIIGAHSTLRATDSVLALPRVTYPLMEPGMRKEFEPGLGLDYPGGAGYVDYAKISNDGRSLELKLTTGENIDQIRVIVASEQSKKAAKQRISNDRFTLSNH